MKLKKGQPIRTWDGIYAVVDCQGKILDGMSGKEYYYANRVDQGRFWLYAKDIEDKIVFLISDEEYLTAKVMLS